MINQNYTDEDIMVPEHLAILEGYDFAISDLETTLENIDVGIQVGLTESEEVPTANLLLEEIKRAILSEAIAQLKSDRYEMLVSLVDSEYE